MTRTGPLVILVVLVVASAFLALFSTGAAAQEVETEIRFEDEVVEGEETTITYVTRVIETPVETDVNAEVTLLVDGEVVETVSKEERVSEGTEIRTEFTHTFASPGEKRVTVNGTASVSPFGPELSDTTTATVTVLAADEGGAGERGDTDDTGDGGDDDDADGGDDDDADGGDEAEETGNEAGNDTGEADGDSDVDDDGGDDETDDDGNEDSSDTGEDDDDDDGDSDAGDDETGETDGGDSNDTKEETDTDDSNSTDSEADGGADTGGTTDDGSDGSSGNESQEETESEGESERQEDQPGMPGFTAVTALLALAVGTVVVVWRTTRRS